MRPSDRSGLGFRASASRARRSAFTLIELLIVVLLIGILARLALPYFDPSVPGQLEAGAEILSADLTLARSLAVANNSTYKFTFDIEKNQYRLQHSGTNTALNTLPTTAFTRTGEVATQRTTAFDELVTANPRVRLHAVLADGVAVTDIEFGPLGETTRSVPTHFWLESGQGEGRRYLEVVLAPVTGLPTTGELQTEPPQ